MNKKIVSIIVCVYNHEKYLKYCLQSLVAQSYEDIELIVINDGSTDDSHNEISKYNKILKERFIKYIYIYKENEGICKTLNQGLDLSIGDYIIPFASDDVMYPSRVFDQVKYLDKHPNFGMTYSDGFYVKSEGDLFVDIDYENQKKFSDYINFQEGDLYDYMLENAFNIPSPTVAFTRECLNTIGPFDEQLECEDIDMFLRVSKEFEIGCIDAPLILQRLHENNTGRNPKVLVSTVKKMIKKYDNWSFRTPGDKLKLFHSLRKALGCHIEVDYPAISMRPGIKKIVGWGCGAYYKNSIKMCDFTLDYLVDSDSDKQGNTVDNLVIKPPNELLKENMNDIFIIVFSEYYKEIYATLKDFGFKYLEHYY